MESQNLIVILRETKRSLRIYCRTDDGFCNSGQRCPPCRMTGWMADNVLKNTQFCEIQQLPKEYRYSYKLSCWHRHSTRSKAKSQNLIVILREAKLSRRIYWITNYKFFAKWNGIAESNCHTAWNEMESQNLLENRWWILQLRTDKSSVQNDTLDGPQWIQGP